MLLGSSSAAVAFYCSSFSFSRHHITTFLVPARLLFFVILFLLCSNNVSSLSFSLLGSSSSTNTNTNMDTSSIFTTIKPSLLESLATTANSYASAHGIQVEKKHPTAAAIAATGGTNVKEEESSKSSYFECAPISLLPNAYPKAAFRRAQNVAVLFNKLVDKIAHDVSFLQSTLGGQVSDADPFTRQLLDLFVQIYGNGNNTNASSSSSSSSSRKKNHAQQAHTLGIFRSDYMLHSFVDPENGDGGVMVVDIKQVELNTIAASFAGLSTRVADLHRYLLARFQLARQQQEPSQPDAAATSAAAADDDDELQRFLNANKQAVYNNKNNNNNNKDAATTSTASTSTNDEELPDGVPLNPALERLAYAMHLATQTYQECYTTTTTTIDQKQQPLAVLFVVQEGESNTVDQRLLEFELFEKHGIPVLRRSLTRLYDIATVDNVTGSLSVDGYEIAVVYYRAGYAPTDYPSGDYSNSAGGGGGLEWKARARIEASRATKCPSLGYHLAGTKKVQQALARPGVLERFMSSTKNPQECAAMRRVFAGLYSTSPKDGMVVADYQAVHDVVVNQNSHLYVLKPQREGGGYNFYGDQLLAKLTQNVQINNKEGEEEEEETNMVLNDALGEYILMQRLFPPEQTAILLRSGRVEGIGKCISELGCFGTILCGPSPYYVVDDDDDDDSSKKQNDDDDGTILHNEYAGFLLRTKFSHVDEGGVASGFATLSSPYLC
jgi:glutathione synthase